MASPAMQPQSASVIQQQMQVYRARMQSGANWFIVVGALSVVNTLITMSGGHVRFIFGLGITSYIDAIGRHSGAQNQTTSLMLSVLFGAFIAVFGFLGRKEQRWAFFVGMALYLCDGLLLLPDAHYLDAAFHLWGLFRIFQGVQALTGLEKLRGAAVQTSAVSTSWSR